MKELGRVTFPPDTTPGGGSPRDRERAIESDREREIEIEKKIKERKVTKTVCHGLRLRDVKVPCTQADASKEPHIHTITHTHTSTQTHVSRVL